MGVCKTFKGIPYVGEIQRGRTRRDELTVMTHDGSPGEVEFLIHEAYADSKGIYLDHSTARKLAELIFKETEAA